MLVCVGDDLLAHDGVLRQCLDSYLTSVLVLLSVAVSCHVRQISAFSPLPFLLLLIFGRSSVMSTEYVVLQHL